MSLRPRILFAFVTLCATALSLRGLKSASVPAAVAHPPIVLTVMGRVADYNEFAERKAFAEFGSRTGIQIRFAQCLQTVNERIELFLGLFRSHSPEPDLIDMDVIWPATLDPYLVDLKPYFREDLNAFAPELLRNFTVNGRVIAIPTFVDAGVLYYRIDLLRRYGFSGPPKTWDELERMALAIQTGERRRGNKNFWGFVWQGGAYESLTCNALEWQSSAGGGEILGADRTVRVRNPQFLHALRRSLSWIGKISPPGQSAFGEDDSRNFWDAGEAAFMRNWTGPYAGIVHNTTPVSDVTAVAALPGGEGGRRSVLGGSGLGVSIYSPHREQAVEALKAIVSENSQRERAGIGGLIPPRVALLQAAEIMSQTPLQGDVGEEVVRSLVARPALQAGRSYNSVSRAYYGAIHSVLARQVSPEEALDRLEAELVKITGFRAVRD